MENVHVVFILPTGERVGADIAANDAADAMALALKIAEHEAPGAVIDSIELPEAA